MENKISLNEFESFKDARGDIKGRRNLMRMVIEIAGIEEPIKITELDRLLTDNGYKGFNISYLYQVEQKSDYKHKIKKDENGERWICFYKK